MGIGEAIAKLFAQEGARVVLSSRELKRVEAARFRIGYSERTLAVACDVRRRDQIQGLAQATLSQFERMDIWINNAGYGLLDSVEKMNIGECRAIFDTNLFGAIEGMQVAIPIMKRQGSGAIVNISSIVGHIPIPYMSAYCATKHALNAVSSAARMELMATGIHVMTVCPGYIKTNFGINAVKGTDRMRLSESIRHKATPDRAAQAVLKGYLSREREVFVPRTDFISIGLYKCFPAMMEKIVSKLMRPAEGIWATEKPGADYR